MVISSVINLCMFEDISLESFRLKIELFGENFKRHNKILFFFTLISFHFFLQAKTFKKKCRSYYHVTTNNITSLDFWKIKY